MTTPDPPDSTHDDVARLIAALDQLGELVKPLAMLLASYDQAMRAAGMEPYTRGVLLTDVQRFFWTTKR